MRESLLLVAIFCAFVCFVCASLPFIEKCKADDPNCIKRSAQAAIPMFAKGVPELGIETMDPLYLKTIDASSPTLKLIAREVYITGLKNCVTKRMERNTANSMLSVKIQCTPKLEGKYEMKGNILILPIEGKGKVHAIIRKVVISINGVLGEMDKAGEKYWIIKSWTSKFELKDRSDLEFENLFNGNELLGLAARDLIRNSANEIILEIGPPVVNAIITKIVENIKHFFSNVPLKDLVLD